MRNIRLRILEQLKIFYQNFAVLVVVDWLCSLPASIFNAANRRKMLSRVFLLSCRSNSSDVPWVCSASLYFNSHIPKPVLRFKSIQSITQHSYATFHFLSTSNSLQLHESSPWFCASAKMYTRAPGNMTRRNQDETWQYISWHFALGYEEIITSLQYATLEAKYNRPPPNSTLLFCIKKKIRVQDQEIRLIIRWRS